MNGPGSARPNMGTPDTVLDCLERLEGLCRSGRSAWTSGMSKNYGEFLRSLDDATARQLVRWAVSECVALPTVAELRQRLRIAGDPRQVPQREPSDYREVCEGRVGKRIFEAAFRRKREEMGQPVDDWWERKFRSWREKDATNAQIGAEIARSAPGARYDPFADEEDKHA